MLHYKQKKTQASKGNRLLISVTVLGSAGPLRFVVNEEELVNAVIDTALKSYAREGRLPILGSDLNDFLLYCPNAGSDALSPLDTIGSQGTRNFMLCKKPPPQPVMKKLDENDIKLSVKESVPTAARKGNCTWKSWLNKSLNLKISSH